MAIPVIDFSKLNGEERAKTLAQIATCCEEWGFFQLINHGISEELLDRVKKVASECYRVERETGFKNSKPVQLLSDLIEKESDERVENVDWEEVFLLSDENSDEWPTRTLGFKVTMQEYREELKKLAIQVMEVMDENLGLPKGYINKAFNGGEDTTNSAFFGTKVSHYPPCPHPEKVNGLRAHTDAGGVILLFQDDEVDGLQILKDGVWIDVQPMKNAIVINTGDQIEVLSNGRYKSVWHRVMARPDGNRRSIASFYNPSLKATIEPAAELVAAEAEKEAAEEESTAKYPRFVFGDYMSVYVEQKFLPKEPRFKAVKAV
ncbi:2-oxoglutarate and oxygenase superfamily protein [Perilla frutescens var. hirtella]|uniref:aminocyclopropanecarboxylate oxidase n=1 Tax=Perilla frutescens var. hirtella TaxID=608512 RepID=A0AAD4JK77_PERFH|nr:2-oxoglutarate and oxygenase superfamily protein [Perilla frutescens var. hirtella]